MTTFGTLFSGGEGVGVGLTAAGLTHLWGVEYDADIAAVAQRNGFNVHVADVRAVDYAALPRVDWLHASPVCTRASIANSGATEAQEDIDTAAAVVRALKAQEPQTFTLENVWQYRTFQAFRDICDALGRMGYFWTYDHVNAADFGVPQTRRRLILRASRGLLPFLPEPVRWVGWYEAIEDLIPTLPESKLAPWQLARLPEELRQSLLFSSNGNNESFGDHHVEAHDPALSVTAQGLGRARAVLVQTQNAIRNATVLEHDAPSTTQTGAMPSRPSHQLAVLIDQANSRDGAMNTMRQASEPVWTVPVYSPKHPEPRAVLISKTADKYGDGHRQSSEQAQTIGANEHGSKALLPTRVVSMTPRAFARFQSVPDWYELPDKRTLAARVIGNMVPPLLMQRIGEGLTA